MEILENREEWLTAFEQDWLRPYQQTGSIDWSHYPRPKNSAAPVHTGIDLQQSRLMLVSSAGGYLRAQQPPFDAANPLGDYSIRRFPTATPFNALAFAHEHYDHTALNQDPQVLLPLRHLEDLAAEGMIGSLAHVTLSFMGYQPDVTRVVDEMIPAVLQAAQAEEVNAVLLVPS